MQYRRSKTNGATFFFTVVTHERERFLCERENVQLKAAFEQVNLKYTFTTDAFVLLPEHIHCIWTLPENDNDYSKRWRLIKSYFSRVGWAPPTIRSAVG